MLLSSFERFGRVAEFDPATGSLTEREAGPAATTHGHYGGLAGTRVVLYREAEGLVLRIGDRRVRLDGAGEIRHEVVGAACTLTVGPGDGSAPALELRYPVPPEWELLADDVTAFAEAENFDLGLLIANIAHDPARAARMYR